MKTCGNCKFWEPIRNGNGECRRRSPTSQPPDRHDSESAPADLAGHWPQTTQGKWCGEHSWNGEDNP